MSVIDERPDEFCLLVELDLCTDRYGDVAGATADLLEAFDLDAGPGQDRPWLESTMALTGPALELLRRANAAQDEGQPTPGLDALTDAEILELAAYDSRWGISALVQLATADPAQVEPRMWQAVATIARALTDMELFGARAARNRDRGSLSPTPADGRRRATGSASCSPTADKVMSCPT